MNIPISTEELVWVIMAIEGAIKNDEDTLEWYDSRGDWSESERVKKRLKRYRDILEKLEAINSKVSEEE